MKLTIGLLLLISFAGCQKQLNTLSVTFARTEPSDSLFSIHNFSLSNQDSVISRLIPVTRSVKHVTVISNLPDGDYYLKYNDILGKAINKKIYLENGINKNIKLITDSIQLEKFYNEIPFNNLQEGKSYTIEMSGGCIATMQSYYKITKEHGNFHFKSYNHSKKLNNYEIDAVKKFEAELLAIEGVNICNSTVSMTFKITNSENAKIIQDKTCNWNGWGIMIEKLNKN